MTEAPITPAPMTPRVLQRVKEGAVFSGVCTGLGQYFNQDPKLIRIIWAIVAIFFGIGVPLYLIMWTVMPDETGKRTWIPLVVVLVLMLLPVCCVFGTMPFALLGSHQ
jgi:phage shock protein C